MALGLSATLVASPALAQESRPLGLALRAGLFWPTNSNTRNMEGDTWFSLGAEYKIRDLSLATMDTGMPAALTLSLDYQGKGNFRHVPVLVNYVARNNQVFYSVGLGVGFTRVPIVGGTDDKTRLAYQLGIGYDFQQGSTPVFVEAKYFGSSRSELNGFGFFLGVRL